LLAGRQLGNTDLIRRLRTNDRGFGMEVSRCRKVLYHGICSIEVALNCRNLDGSGSLPYHSILYHSRTMSLLNRAWKPGCSLGTSVHSALETFVTMRYINPHLPLPLPLW